MTPTRRLLHYVLTRKLGQGGMGEVWQATDTTLGREVAIKLLPAEMSCNAERMARFEREARLLASLNHPNIATIHGLHEDGDVRFLAMELVEGRALSALIPTGGIEMKPLLDIAVPMADALGAAHERGITHRDLKPDNVMVTEEGRVKVLDFGLAKLAGEAGAGPPDDPDATALKTASVTQEGRILGTVNYMSPEQAEGKSVDARSDVFALGILLYEMAVGRRPFSGDTPISTLSSIIKDQPPSLTDLKEGLPRHLDHVVRRCLSKDPARRYPDGHEVRNELEHVRAEVDSGLSASISTPSLPRAAAPGRPRWLVPAIVGALVVGALGVAAYSLRGDRQAASAATGAGTATARTSIAVLPFVDLSPGGDKEYFGDGIAEELINRLARVEGLRVSGRTSSFAFRGREQDLRAIGESLGVETIMEGSVRSAGDQVRVTAQLVGVSDGFQLWSRTYDRALSDIFALQDEIAQSIVAALRATLGTDPAASNVASTRPSTTDVEAYQDYLKARHLLQQRTGDSLREAIDGFQRAVEHDPGFAEAYAGLASAWIVLPGYSNVPREEVTPEASAAARRALEIDPRNAESYAVLGSIAQSDTRWIEARESYERALEANPNETSALLWYGALLLTVGRVEEGERRLRRVYEIDPASGVINGWMGHLERARGNTDAAVDRMREAERLGWGAASSWIATTLYEAGRNDELIEYLESLDEDDPGRGKKPIEALLEAEHDDAVREEILRRVREAPLSAVSVEAVLRLGTIDEVFAALDRPRNEIGRISNNATLAELWGPRGDAFRRDPRFAAWAAGTGLLEYWQRFGWPAGCSPEGDGVRCR